MTSAYTGRLNEKIYKLNVWKFKQHYLALKLCYRLSLPLKCVTDFMVDQFCLSLRDQFVHAVLKDLHQQYIHVVQKRY